MTWNPPVVLVVDDQPEILRLTETFLADVDCDVMTATNGEEALEVVARRAPDLVLLDYQMPRMDGFAVCRALKADPATRLIPVVIVTATHDTEHRIAALEAGADDFLSKPVEIAELQARVRSLIRLKRVFDRLDDTEHVIFALARAVEAKDSYTEAHTERVARTAPDARRVAGAVRRRPRRPLPRRHGARHRQDRDPRLDPAQAGQAHPRGVGGHAQAP